MICLGANSSDKKTKRKTITQSHTKKHPIGIESSLRNIIHESFQQQTNYELKQAERAGRKELSFSLTSLLFDDDLDDMQSLQQPCVSSLQQISPGLPNFCRYYSGGQLLQRFPIVSNRNSSTSKTIYRENDDSLVPMKYNSTTETQNAFMQFDSEDDDNDNDGVECNDSEGMKCDALLPFNSKWESSNVTALSSHSTVVSGFLNFSASESSNCSLVQSRSILKGDETVSCFADLGLLNRDIHGEDSNQFHSERNDRDSQTVTIELCDRSYSNELTSKNEAKLYEFYHNKRKKSVGDVDNLHDTPPGQKVKQNVARGSSNNNYSDDNRCGSIKSKIESGINCKIILVGSNSSYDRFLQNIADDNEERKESNDETRNANRDESTLRKDRAACTSTRLLASPHSTDIYKCDFNFALNGSETKIPSMREDKSSSNEKRFSTQKIDHNTQMNSDNSNKNDTNKKNSNPYNRNNDNSKNVNDNKYNNYNYNDNDSDNNDDDDYNNYNIHTDDHDYYQTSNLKKNLKSVEVITLSDTPLQQKIISHVPSLSSPPTSCFQNHSDNETPGWVCKNCTLENGREENHCNACGCGNVESKNNNIYKNMRRGNGNNIDINNTNDDNVNKDIKEYDDENNNDNYNNGDDDGNNNKNKQSSYIDIIDSRIGVRSSESHLSNTSEGNTCNEKHNGDLLDNCNEGKQINIKQFSKISDISSWTRPTRSPNSRTSGACRPSAPAVSQGTAPGSTSVTSTTRTTGASARSRRRKARTSASSRRSARMRGSTSSASSRRPTAGSRAARCRTRSCS